MPVRCDDLYIDSTGVWFPPKVTSADAVAQGWLDQETLERSGQIALTVAEDAGPKLAVRAAHQALTRSRYPASSISMLLYATAHFQGLDAWNAAAYVQEHTIGAGDKRALEIRNLSNGGMAAIELGAAFLDWSADTDAVLLATGDRFAMPSFDRWRADPMSVMWGDAGTALVLCREPGFARVLSLITYSDPSLEGLHRGDDPFLPAPHPDHMPADIHRRKHEFFGRMGMTRDDLRAKIRAGTSDTAARALAEAGVTAEKVSWFLMPHGLRTTLDRSWLPALGIDLSRTLWHWFRSIGHLGAGDYFADIDYLVTSGRVQPGDFVLLVGNGAGTIWTCGVVEILEVPRWAIR